MNIIRHIAKKELLNEVAGISFIVRRWANILKKEVEDQLKTHKEEELAKIKTTTKPTEKNYNRDEREEEEEINGNQLEMDFPENDVDLPMGDIDDENANDPFYWKDETGRSSNASDKDWDDFDEWESRFRYDKSDWRDKGGYWRRRKEEKKAAKKKKNLGYPENHGSGSGYYGGRYGGGGGYNYIPQPYIPPLEEVVIYGDSFPDEYKEFAVDMWVLKNSTRIEYDHYKSGYAESGEYIVYLNVPLASMSDSAFVHEIKHAYDDWNRMRHGGKPIRDTWEIKNIYTKDFEKLILGASTQFTQLGPVVRYLYLGSKLETPAYLENEYDNTMIDYEDVGRKLMKFKASNYLDNRGNPARGIEGEFKSMQKYDIPLFKKFKNVVEFLYWVEKYFNKRGNDIFKRVAKMRYVHGRKKPVYTTTYTPNTYSTYKKPEEKDDDEIGDWVYTKEKGWHEKDDVKKEEKTTYDFEEGESMGGWKYSKDRGWYFDPDEEKDLDKPWY